ncbi:primase alpha helix C-terminal domain-containing protein [Lysobacter tyrosinilyticus]
MQIDTAMAARFLTALTGDCTHTFQTFDDTGKSRPGMNRVLHGSFASQAQRLAGLNDKGAGVFVMVNRGDGFGRKADNVTACRALFVDLDGAPIEPVLSCQLPPRIVVESSPGKWHAYWPIADMPLEQFTPAQKTLAALFAGDPKVHDRSRVMRLPGFLHRKGNPFQTRLDRCEAGVLAWREMSEAFGLAQRMVLPNAIPEGARNDTLYKLACSAAAKGVPQPEQFNRLLQVNDKRCHPPLDPREVQAIVASAYSAPQRGVASIPLAVMDSPAYKRLSNAGRTLVLLAYRKLDGFNNGRLSLAWSECVEWFSDSKTFYRVRKEVLASGLLTESVPSQKPRPGQPPTAALYGLPIGVKYTPYEADLVGVKYTPLEALQALASDAPEDLDLDGGQFPKTVKAERAA